MCHELRRCPCTLPRDSQQATDMLCKSDVFSFWIHWTADQRHLDSKQLSGYPMRSMCEENREGKRHKEQHRLDFPMKSCITEASTILIFATLLNQKTYCIKDIKSHFYNQYFIFQWLQFLAYFSYFLNFRLGDKSV